MSLTNSGSCRSWSPQLFDMMSNGSSRGPAFSLEEAAAAGCGSSWPGHSSSTTLLNFAGAEDDDCAMWIAAVDRNHYMSRRFEMRTTNSAEIYPLEGQSRAQVMNGKGQKKRPILDCNFPSPKKRCGIARTAKDKQSPSKHPQSITAKNRRERISERLRILQDLVPNGAKVDLVTMLEKAINYVKFLQLQVKVLATDEFWPAPDVARVKEAIDAILSSSRDESSKS